MIGKGDAAIVIDHSIANHILLIRDEELSNSESLSAMLVEARFEVTVVSDSTWSIAPIQNHLPDLILLEAACLEATHSIPYQSLQSHPGTQTIPIILVTEDREIPQTAHYPAGIVDHLSRPLQPIEVLTKVRLHLQLQKLTQQLGQQERHLQQEVQKRIIAEDRLHHVEKQLQKEAVHRQQIEEQLQQYEKVVANTADGLALVDRNYQYCFVNSVYFQRTGKTWDEIIGQPVTAIHGSDAFEASIRPNLERCFAGETIQFESWFDYPSIGRRFVTVTYSPYWGSEGKIDGAVVSTQDVTELKQAEESLKQSETNHLALLRALPDLIMRVSREGVYLDFISTEIFNVIGQAGDFIGTRVEESLPSTLAQMRTQAIHQALETGSLQVYEHDIVIGNRVQTEEIRVVACGPDEALLLVRDISDRKQAELALHKLNEELEAKVAQRTAALQQSEAELRSIFDLAAVGIVQVDPVTFQFIKVNQQFCDSVGYSAAELLQRTTADITLPEDRAENQILFQQMLDRKISSFTLEKRYVCKDGSLIWATVTGSLVWKPDGSPHFAIGVVQDISDRKRAEEALHQLNAELEQRVEQRTLELKIAKEAADQANRAKSDFLSNMSHELRTPLNGILGYTQLFEKDATLNPKQQEGIQIISQCGEHLLTLIEDILDLSKIEAQKLELYPNPLCLLPFLQGITEICRLKAQQKSLTFIYQPSLQLPQIVIADEKRLRQVLLNLLSNAIKFTDEGSVIFQVDVLAPAIDPNAATIRIRFAVEDTGIGIAPEDFEKIFLPFEQVGEKHRQHEGTGLGLSISQRMVELMDSRLLVKSEEGKGSIFWFDVEFDIKNDGKNICQKERSAVTGYDGRRQTVLLVDDRPKNLLVLRRTLESLGFLVIEAMDGREGIEQAIQHTPDLVITDLVMPGMDGFEMIRQLRSMTQFQQTPILSSSASAYDHDRIKSHEAGSNDFLVKPIELNILVEKLQQHLKLTWIYAKSMPPPAPPITIEPYSFKADQLPPANLLRELSQLAAAGFFLEIENHLAQLAETEQCTAFVQQLLPLTYEFEGEKIQALFEHYLQQLDQ